MKETKPKDLRSLTVAELKTKVTETREKLFELRLRKATRQVEDTSGLRALKRDIARYETLARERAKAAA
jgi:large subunit ribosomal protein L29